MKKMFCCFLLCIYFGLMACSTCTPENGWWDCVVYPQPNQPALQQFYQLPQERYYTAPPPKVRYYDPSRDVSPENQNTSQMPQAYKVCL